MNEIIGTPTTETAIAEAMISMRDMMGAMAEMIRSTNERMTALETQVKSLTKVTPAQAAAIKSAIRDRAAVVCVDHCAEGGEKDAAAAIRAAMKLLLGVRAVRDIPRGDYGLAMDAIAMWDDFGVMKGIASRMRSGVV